MVHLSQALLLEKLTQATASKWPPAPPLPPTLGTRAPWHLAHLHDMPFPKENSFGAQRMREEKLNYNMCLIIQNLPPTQSNSAKFWKIVICKITATYSFCNYCAGKRFLY